MSRTNRRGGWRSLVPALAVVWGLAGAACGGSEIPFEPRVDAPPQDAAPDVAAALDVAPADTTASDLLAPDACTCEADAACTATDPACAGPACGADEDCRDEDVCTADRCDTAAGVCVHEPIPDCCAGDAACDDGVDCTQDRCVGRICQHEPQGEGCCTDDAGCDDGFADTDDVCARNRCVHALQSPPAACVTEADCPATNPCAAATCVSGLCSYGPGTGPRCCTEDAACEDEDVCTEDYCVAFRCVYTLARAPQPRVTWDFDGDGPPADLDLGDAEGDAQWHVTEAAAWSAPASLRAGTPESDGYGGVGAFRIVAETASVAFPAGGAASLRFRTLLDIEPDEDKDRVSVEVVPQSGDPVEIWTGAALGGTTEGAWSLETASLNDFAGKSVRLRFVFASDGAPSGPRGGWHVDDVQLVYPCQTPRDDR